MIQKKISTLEDIMSIKESYIFNCLGTENKDIFDKDVQELKAFYLSVKKESKNNPENLAFWISS